MRQRKSHPGDSRTRNGSFELYYHDGYACLTVYPPSDSGRPVYAEDVENRMKLLGIPKVPRVQIREVIERADRTPVPLVHWPDGKALGAEIRVDVSEDGLEARLVMSPPRKGGAPPSRTGLDRALSEAGVIYGIDDNAIRSALERLPYHTPVVIAEGTKPVHGVAERIAYHFNTDRLRPYLVMPFDRINLKELNFIEHCREEQLLAELQPAVDPVDGRTVTGDVIPAERDSSRVELAAGPNTTLSHDGKQLFAECDGNVRLDERGIVTVEPVVVVQNVNYETGNIRYEGSVIVEGSIADGFVVEAGGDLQIGKGVGKAQLRSGRNLVIKTGINGNGEGRIDCGGDLYARFLESCTAHVDGHLFVEEAIMHSQVTAGGNCAFSGRRAEVIGGRVIAGGSLWCRKLGNLNEVGTRVAVGVPPHILLAYYEARRALSETETEVDDAEEALSKLDTAVEEGRRDERIEKARAHLKDRLPSLREARRRLRQEVPDRRDRIIPDERAMVVAEDTIFPGTVVTMGTYEYRPSGAGSHKTILHPGTSAIVETGYDLRTPPSLEFRPTDATSEDR